MFHNWGATIEKTHSLFPSIASSQVAAHASNVVSGQIRLGTAGPLLLYGSKLYRTLKTRHNFFQISKLCAMGRTWIAVQLPLLSAFEVVVFLVTVTNLQPSWLV